MDEGVKERIADELFGYSHWAIELGHMPGEEGSLLNENIYDHLMKDIPQISDKLAGTNDVAQAEGILIDTLEELVREAADDAQVSPNEFDAGEFIANFAGAIAAVMDEEKLFAV